jgi:outer membrane protein OmpA-like peptidoglycan-associated protein
MKKFLLLTTLLFSISSFSQQRPDSKLELFFDVNKYVLTKQHLMLIDSAIISKSLVVTSIIGFADSTGKATYNIDLSQKRASSVFQYFTSQHYSDSIIMEYFGEQNAVGSDMSYDRRVEIWFKERITEKVIVIEEKIQADTLAITEKYEISNIYFLPDQPIVDPMSFFAVDDAAKYLKRFLGCKFEIVGHVNYVMPPSLANNPKSLEPAQRLSEERAKEVYGLLAERGIPIEDMTHNGVGNSQMVFKNPKNDSEKRKNMRVEILISCKK